MATMAKLLKRSSSENLSNNAPELKRGKSKRGSRLYSVNVLDAIEVTLTRDEPNVRAGVQLNPKFTDRAIVESVLDGSPAAATDRLTGVNESLKIRPGDEILAVDGVSVTSAKHMVQLMKECNKLEVVLLKSKRRAK